MENVEEIKDPNQLDLFAGILLTTKQQQEVDEFIARQSRDSIKRETENQRLEKLLVEAGFIKGVHFKNNFKSFFETRTVKLGYSYNDTNFETEVGAVFTEGGVYLLAKRFDTTSKKIVEYNTVIDVQLDKVRCSSIHGQYRFIKPKTLLEKLEQYNKKAQYEFDQYVKANELLINTIEKYTKLYPNATITNGTDYVRYGTTYTNFPIVTVLFESGSYIIFRLDVNNSKEYLHKKHDAEHASLSVSELLERFSKQVKKEGSN
jgi:DNA-binding Lrp family transcriptional regulator